MRAEKVQSGQYKDCKLSYGSFCISSQMPHDHQLQQLPPVMYAWDAVCVPAHNSLCGVSVRITETRRSWYSSSNITSEPDSLCPGSCSLQKALAVSKDVAGPVCDLKI